jgi:hypothetical protein
MLQHARSRSKNSGTADVNCGRICARSGPLLSKEQRRGRLSDEPLARPTTWLFDKGPEMRLSDAV